MPRKLQSEAGGWGGKIAPMTSPRYVHLRLHSEYSVTDGIVRIGDAVKRAAADGMPALAVTDLCNLFGLVKFYTGARGKGVKPIVGADVWIANPEAPDAAYRLLLLARNRVGYQQLCELLTKAYLAEGRRDRAEIRREWFTQLGCDGLLALSGGHLGDVGDALINGNFDLAGERASAWEVILPGAIKTPPACIPTFLIKSSSRPARSKSSRTVSPSPSPCIISLSCGSCSSASASDTGLFWTTGISFEIRSHIE